MNKIKNIFKQWIFVPCDSPSDSRVVLSNHIISNMGGNKLRLTVKGSTFGYEYK